MRGIWFIVAFLVCALDQATKFYVSLLLGEGGARPVIKNFFHLTLVHNTGAAFGLFQNAAFFFAGVSLITVVLIIFFMKKKNSDIVFDAGLAMILGGAAGNLLDRLRLGYVVDFIDFRIWPVFNVADSCITIGAFLILLSVFIHKRGTK